MEKTLREAERKPEELADAVEARRKRLADIQRLARRPEHERCESELQKAIAAADAKLAAAEQAHTDVVSPLAAELATVQAELATLHNLRRELQRTCDDPEVLGNLADVRGRLAKARTALDEARRNVQHKQNLAHQAGALAGESRQDEPDLKRQAERCGREADALASELPALEQSVSTLETEERTVLERMTTA